MVKIESLPAKEFFVLRGVAKLYDEGVQPDPETDVWRSIRQRITDGSVERLK
jgi:hypothetical protein